MNLRAWMILKPNFFPCWLLLTAISSMCPTRPFLCTNFLSTRMVPTATTWSLASSVIVIVWSFGWMSTFPLSSLHFPDFFRYSSTYIHGYVSSCNWIALEKQGSAWYRHWMGLRAVYFTCKLLLGMAAYFSQDGQHVKESTFVIIGSKSTQRVSSRQLGLHFRAKQVGFEKRDFRHGGKREGKMKKSKTNRPWLVIYTWWKLVQFFRGYRAK